MDTRDLPYLTCDLPGVGGAIKQHLADFQVDEIPLYEPCGEGDHVYFQIRKAGVPTPVAVSRIAQHMGVVPTDIGFAGLKDAQAITTQMMSLEHADPDHLRHYRDAQVQVVSVTRHRNKLRMGHLAGNRFAIRVRQVPESLEGAAREILDVLVRRGVPNYFGEQRFGARRDTDRLGEALIKGDDAAFINLLLGQAQPEDPPDCRAARDAFDSGFLDRALQCWPRHYANERKALSAFKKKRNPGRAMMAVDKRMRRLYVNAFQSAVFNEVLARRIQSIDRVLTGDLAQKTDSGGVFLVEDGQSEQPRAEQFEISPTGPIFGSRCRLAEGDPGLIERQVLEARGIGSREPVRVGSLKLKGARRPLRFAPMDVQLTSGSDSTGGYLELAFSAPPGCYATILLREIMKPDPLAGPLP